MRVKPVIIFLESYASGTGRHFQIVDNVYV